MEPKGPRHHSLMKSTIEVDQNGMVTLVDIATGRVCHLHPIDAKEQLAFEKPTLRVATTSEAPPPLTAQQLAFEGETFKTLREYAQDAGITFTGKSKAGLVTALVEISYKPKPAEEPTDDY